MSCLDITNKSIKEKSLDKLSKDEMRTKIKEFSAILKSQREHWDEENNKDSPILVI